MAGLKKLLKRHGGKKNSASSKEDVGAGAGDGGEIVFGYVIAKDKDLPKLHKAVWNGDTAKVKQLCKKADVNQFDKENRTPLHLACSCGNNEIAQFLLTNKAKTNLCDNDGRTALMKAVECSHQGCITLLLQHNADVKVRDKNSSSPLHLAAANNLIDTATLLLEKGIDIDVCDKEGFTALHVACSLGHQDFVLYLLNKGANVNSTDAHDRTSLMTAAADGHVDIVKMLLQNNADIGLKDHEGWKGADHAIMNGNHSCAKVMDEHEREAQEREKKKMEEVQAKRKKPDINEVLRSSSPINGDIGFSFGGPAADKNSVDGNLRSDGSTSRHSDGDDSWGSSSEDDKFEVNKKSSKISLAAALQKVERSTSNISDKSQSRIPVPSQTKRPSSDPVPAQQKVTSPSSQPSKIPRFASATASANKDTPSSDVTQSHSPRDVSALGRQGALSPTASAKSAGSPSGRNSPSNAALGSSPQVRSRVVSPTESVRSAGSDMQGRVGQRESGGSLPLEYLQPTEEKIDFDQRSKKNGGKSLGYSPSVLSTGADRSNRNLADELGLSLSSSEGGEEEEDDESVMSGEVDLENSDEKIDEKDGRVASTVKPEDHGRQTSTVKPEDHGRQTSTVKPEEGRQTQEAQNPAAYLGLDLDISISSVSDPDISGMSNHNEERRDKKNTGSLVQKSDEPEKEDFNEDADSNWDSSESFLPSDNVPGQKFSPKVSVKSNHDKELQAAVERRRENMEIPQDNHVDNGSSILDEDVSEVTESESEVGKEKNVEEMRNRELEKIKESGVVKMKSEEGRKEEIKRKLEIEKEEQKEEARRLEWERQEREKELELAESIKKELEEELEEELGTDGENEGSEGEEVESYSERESELKSGGSGNLGGQEETLGDFEEQGSSKWDSTDDEGPHDGEVSDEDLRDSEVSVGTDATPEDTRVSELKFENQMDLKEQEMIIDRLNNNNSKEPILEKMYVDERYAVDDRDIEEDGGQNGDIRISGDNKGIAVDARRLQKEEDELLEAYKARQEEMLEQERRMEEELARKERERIEGLRVELERRKEEERGRMEALERQRKEREVALEKEKEEFEEEMRRKEEKERELKKKKKEQDEMRRIEMDKKDEKLNEMKRKEEENKARPQNMLHSIPEQQSSVDVDDKATVSPTDSYYVSKTNAERLLTEKHRGFVEHAGNATAIELQKVQNRGRLADKSREIKQRRLEAKADLDAVRLQTTQLTEPSVTTPSPKRESASAVTRDIMHVSAEAEMMNPSVPSVINSEWSTSSDDEQPTPHSRAKTPLSSRDGGLGSSLSPGVQSAMRPSLLHSLPLLSSSPTIMECSPVVAQLKESLRDSKRQLEKTQEKFILSEAKMKQLESHADDLQSKLEVVVDEKSEAERELFEITEEKRVLNHECIRATEEKKIVEVLVETVKEQLGRSEEKLNREIKLRRTVEESGKQLETDRVNLENALRHLTEEHEDLKEALEREHEQCLLKDELYKEQRKQIEEIIMESQKVSQHRAEVLTKLETVDESRKHVEASSESTRKELIHAKSEVGRLNLQLETITKLSQNEVDSLKRQLSEQTEKTRRLEETLAKVRSHYDTQLSQLQSDNNELQNKLENEVTTKHRLQSETSVLQSRLQSAEKERDEANKTRAETERQLHSLREELYKSKSSMEKELSSLRENNQLSTLKLNAAENKMSSLESELQTANIMLAERSSQMSINIRDIDNKRSSLTKLETDLRGEKETNARLSAKLEITSEKMRNLENESTNLRYQLEMTSEKVRKQEENSQETQNKLHSTITEITTDHEKTKGKMSEKERSLADALQKYKDETEQSVSKLKLQDEDIRRLQQELAESARKFSAAEASLEIQVKARKDLENERESLRETLRSYEEQISTRISESHMVNGHASALQNELEHSRRVSDETSQRLATTSYDLENLEKVKVGLEEDLTKLRLDRVKLEATLKEEKAKTNLLLGEIRENNEGRTQLQSLLSKIKSSNIELEEKLQVESFDKTHHARDAEEAKGLWELELRARSKLGAKIMENENKLNETKAAVEEEKKKTRKALESRKMLQGKLDVYEKRFDQHQQEVQTLKTQMKTYRRRLKENENSEKRIPTMQAEFNREIVQYEANTTSLRNQLRDLNERLRQEGDMRVLVERRGQQREKELSSAKAQSKEQLRQVQKLEKLNRQMEDETQSVKDHYKENFVDKAQLERMKLDLEAKSRIEVNRKLADVNAHLEEQALARDSLERSRSEQETEKLQEMENTISSLKRDVEHYRSNSFELQTQKETIAVEAERFKDMYESETKRKEKLNDLLFKEREKAAESKALLNLERSRSSKFLENTNVSLSYQSPGTIGVPKHASTETKSPGFIYSQPKEMLMESVDKELSKSIQRHLDSISTNGPSDLWASKQINMTSSPLSSNDSQYMETLKRNYFV